MAAASFDEVGGEFAAEVGDVDVEQAGVGFVLLVEEVFVEVGAGDDFALVEDEVFEQGVFASGERDRGAGDPSFAGGGVE